MRKEDEKERQEKSRSKEGQEKGPVAPAQGPEASPKPTVVPVAVQPAVPVVTPSIGAPSVPKTAAPMLQQPAQLAQPLAPATVGKPISEENKALSEIEKQRKYIQQELQRYKNSKPGDSRKNLQSNIGFFFGLQHPKPVHGDDPFQTERKDFENMRKTFSQTRKQTNQPIQ
jgi:hypothetical protein